VLKTKNKIRGTESRREIIGAKQGMTSYVLRERERLFFFFPAFNDIKKNDGDNSWFSFSFYFFLAAKEDFYFSFCGCNGFHALSNS
jgi:hypothetical protein